MFSVTNEVGCVSYVYTQHICPCVCVCCLAVQLHIERNLYKESLCLQTRHVPLNFGDPLVLWGMVGGAAPAQSVTLSIPRRETVSCIIYYLESQIVWGGWMDGCLLVGLPNICLSLSVFFIFSINNINLLLCAMCDCDICVNIISFTL